METIGRTIKNARIEMYIKVRWHSLVQGFQRDDNFKYAKLMTFVQRIIVKQPKVENWPEFVITEEDLKDDRNSTHDQEEFEFLEIDEEDSKIMECKTEVLKEKIKDCKMSSGQMDENSKERDKSCIKDNPKVENITKSEEDKNENGNLSKMVETSSSNKTTKVEEKMAAVDVNKNNEEIFGETKQQVVEKQQPVINERCEDVIFGELVSATLKRMDENKKKNIKKEIMNLLFS
ncbi:uncharacterized protein ACRADG_009944 isoform 2-T2 [Cochliomyia hominivorax]